MAETSKLKSELHKPGTMAVSSQRHLMQIFALIGLFCFLLLLEDKNLNNVIDSPSSMATKETSLWESPMQEKEVSSAKETAWKIAIQQAKELLEKKDISRKTLPSCLIPNTEKTLALVRDRVAANSNNKNTKTPLLPLPIMNMGMPKSGSTTLFDFFTCIGLSATHWTYNTNDFEGLCMRDAVSNGLPPIASCGPNTDAFMQFDVEYPYGVKGKAFGSKETRDECFFPQLSLLEEIHAEDPNVTFVINFRPIDDWVKSVTNWERVDLASMMLRFQLCNLPNLPRGVPKDLGNKEDVIDTMMEFFCSHVQHLRNFVEAHPSHALIELDLYDTETSSAIMGDLFGSPECWGHGNKSSNHKGKNGK